MAKRTHTTTDAEPAGHARPAASAITAGASLPDRVGAIHAENLVMKAVYVCRPGMKRGVASVLWSPAPKGIGMGLVYEAARLALLHHLSAADVRARLKIAARFARPLDRLLSSIRDAHTELLFADVDKRVQAEQTAGMTGDVVAKSAYAIELVIDGMLPVLKTLNWDEMEAADRHTTARMIEVIADAPKTFADAMHKGIQTDLLERRLAELVGDAVREHKPLDHAAFRAIVDEALGLRAGKPAAAPAAPAAPALPAPPAPAAKEASA